MTATFELLDRLERNGALDRSEMFALEQIRATNRIADSLKVLADWAEENWSMAAARRST